MGGVGGVGLIKKKLEAKRAAAMSKLERGKTLDYNPESLERMKPELLKSMCIKYRLDTEG